MPRPKKTRKKFFERVDRRGEWRAAAQQLGGRLEEGKKPHQDRIVVEHAPWNIVIDTFTVQTGYVAITYTRGRAFFSSRSELKCSIRKRNAFDRLLGLIGLGSSVRVNRMFDERYVVRGKPVSALRGIVTSSLADTLMSQKRLNLGIKRASRKERKASGENTSVVTALVDGPRTEVDILAGIVAGVRDALDALQRTGAATREPVSLP